MNRRQFVQSSAALTAGVITPDGLSNIIQQKALNPSSTHLISSNGCGRATGYAEANKVISSGNLTHVTWLDALEDGFRVQIRTYDRAHASWSPVYTIGEAYDNHGGPALTTDDEGYLHVVYYPHHHHMRYRKSTRPHDASSWGPVESFGENLTYPSLLFGPNQTLYLSCRRSFENQPWCVELWKRSPGTSWTRISTLLRSRFLGYAHFQESLAWSPDGNYLHVCCRLHEHSDGDTYGLHQTVGYMVSADQGKTWYSSSGKELKTPVESSTIEVLYEGGIALNRIPRAGGMGVDAAGTPHLLYSVKEKLTGRSFLVRRTAPGSWEHLDLHTLLPDPWRNKDLLMPGGLSFNTNGEMYICAQSQHLDPERNSWGTPEQRDHSVPI